METKKVKMGAVVDYVAINNLYPWEQKEFLRVFRRLDKVEAYYTESEAKEAFYDLLQTFKHHMTWLKWKKWSVKR